MSRPIVRWAAILQIALTLFTGCSPVQPFFVPRHNGMAEYLDQAMAIEYADVQVESLPEATDTRAPLGPDNVPTEFVDLSLEDCISMALQNSKILRVVSGSNQQTGSVAAALLSASPGQMPSVYDPAIVSSTASSQPLTIDNNGNRVPLRGAVRSNQVGGVQDALSEFDTQFSAVFGYNTTDRPRNVGRGNIFNPQLFQAVDANAQAALSKKMATGGVASARFTTIYSSNNIPASGNAAGSTNFGRAVPSDYTSALELQVTHPLLRGRGTLVNRIPVVLARINEDIALHDFEGNITNLVKSVEDAYWDLHAGYRIFEANKKARDAALDLWKVANARTRADGAPEAEAQARALYYQFESQLRTSYSGSTVPGNDPRGLLGREQILREKIGWAATDCRFIRPCNEPTLAKIQFDWCDATAEGLRRNVYLRRQKWAIQARSLELMSDKNQLLAQLDASIIYRFVGIGDVFANADRNGISFPNPGSSALEGLTDGDYQEFGGRLELTPPALGARRQLANVQNGYIQLAKSQEELKEKEIQLVNELTTAWRSMESNYFSVKDYFDEWQANEVEIKIHNDKISSSVGELNQLLDNLLRAEQRRAQAEKQYYQAISEYNKSIATIHYLKGSLLDLNNVALQEGQWVDKAYWDARERTRERESGIYMDYGYTRPAVVSQGPVAQGMLTEGNAATPGTVSTQSAEPESEDSNNNQKTPDSDRKQLPPLPERKKDAPVARFDWGNFGNDSTAQAPQSVAAQAPVVSSVNYETTGPVTANLNDQSANTLRAGSTTRTSPSAQPQWRPKVQ